MTVRDHNKLKCWKIILTFCRFFLKSDLESLLILSPSIMISPEVGSSRLLNIRINVLLPAPENPITPKIEPDSIFKST